LIRIHAQFSDKQAAPLHNPWRDAAKAPLILSNFASVDLSAMPSLDRGEARAHRVPLITAAADNFRAYGRLASDFARDRVTIVTWP
jgi:hypothetical protein